MALRQDGVRKIPLREIFEVEVSDEKFKSFLELVEKYRNTVASMPGLWGKSNAATKEILAGVTAISGAQQEMFRQGAAASERLERSASGLHALWGGINTRVESFAAGLERAALRLGGLTALGAGLLGIGGLWGLENYAASAGRARRTAQGLGTTVPGMMAFEAEYGRYVDPGSFMEAIAGAQTDPTQRGWLYNIGLNNAQIGQDPAQTGPLAMQRIWQLLHRLPRWEVGLAPQMFGLDRAGIGADEARRIYDTPYSDFAVSMQRFQRDQQQFHITDDDLKRWQDLNRQLDVAGKTLWAVFGTSLARWAPEIDQLSQSFTHLVQEIVSSDGFRHVLFEASEGLRRFGDYLKSPELQQDWKKFTDTVGTITSTIGTIASGLSTLAQYLKFFFYQEPKETPDTYRRRMEREHPFWYGPINPFKGDVYGPMVPKIIGEAMRSGAGSVAQQALIAGAINEGGLSESWKGGDFRNGVPTSYGPWQLHIGGEYNRYIQEGNAPGDILAETRYALKRLNEIYPGFSKITDPDLAARIVAQFERGSLGAQDYARSFEAARKAIERARSEIGPQSSSQSPNIQQPPRVTLYLHGYTGAVSPISANNAAGGVY